MANTNTNEVKQWTVIVLWDETGEVTTHLQAVAEPHEAMQLTARELYDKGNHECQVITAVAGDVLTMPPCEDSGKAAYVTDLKGDEVKDVQ